MRQVYTGWKRNDAFGSQKLKPQKIDAHVQEPDLSGDSQSWDRPINRAPATALRLNDDFGYRSMYLLKTDCRVNYEPEMMGDPEGSKVS
ncbi:MAG: hypothetical protein IPM27_06345 [Nitrosomonadales bacterium]|nr:hypothetical protein [Nitrosomonadales bacterium]